jgi:hypothetical protein
MTIPHQPIVLRQLGLTAERVREMLPYCAPPPRTTTPYVLRNKAIIRSPKELQNARDLFNQGQTFRQVRQATGMSMAKLKKIKEGTV